MSSAEVYANSAEVGKLPLIFAILAGVFAYLALKNLMHMSILEVLNEIFVWFRGSTANVVKAKSEREAKRLARMSRDQKRKTWLFRYNILLNDILLDMGWKQMGVSVDGLTTLIIIISIVINALGIVIFQNALVFVIGVICVYCVVVCAMYSISRNKARYRKSVLMATEDLLCSSIQEGLVKCVKRNLAQFDPIVKDEFEAFIFDREQLAIPIDVCIDRLNDRLGSRFDNFCSLAKTFELDYTDGLEDSFQINIEDNAVESELDEEIYEAVFEMNVDYFGVCGILIAFFLMTLGIFSKSMPKFYFGHWGGKLLLGLYIIALVGGYIYTQYMTGKKLEGRSDS
jgi:hypothetical protein